MKKIAVLQDLSGLGRCSLTAAIPVISVMGVQACPLPTAILSNQTGYPSFYCEDYTNKIQYFIREWKKLQMEPDGIYTGFLAGERQAEEILKFVHAFRNKETKVIVDPVMGDGGKKYDFFTEHLLEQMKMLVSEADMITPNITEALILCGDDLEASYHKLEMLDTKPEAYQRAVEEVGNSLKNRFGLEAVVITGNHYQNGTENMVGNLIIQGQKKDWVESSKVGGSYSGTGDLFASVLSAGLVKGESLRICAEKAVRMLRAAIGDAVKSGSDRNDGVEFEKYHSYLWD